MFSGSKVPRTDDTHLITSIGCAALGINSKILLRKAGMYRLLAISDMKEIVFGLFYLFGVGVDILLQPAWLAEGDYLVHAS